MEGHGPEPDYAVAARSRIEARNRERERRAAQRATRERVVLWLCAPLLLPAAGAALALAALDAAGLLAAVVVACAPAVVTVALARHRPPLEVLGWVLITLTAEVALFFWVGLVALGYGPDR